jgi:hypothetical protein
VVAGRAVARLEEELGLQVDRCFVGNFMTSLDMSGVSLTLLRVGVFGQHLKNSILRRCTPSIYPGWWVLGVGFVLCPSLAEMTSAHVTRVLATNKCDDDDDDTPCAGCPSPTSRVRRISAHAAGVISPCRRHICS